MTLACKPIAVLIDAENVLQPDLVECLLEKLATLGTVGLKRIYGNEQSLEKWKGVAMRFGIQPMLQFNPLKGKNATDFAMTIDAMDLLHSRRFGAFCIVSSDGDFLPLARRIQADGLAVYNCGSEKQTVESRKPYTNFFPIDSLIEPKVKETRADKPVAKEKASHKPVKSAPTKAELDGVCRVLANPGNGSQEMLLTSFGQKLRRELPGFEAKKYGHAGLKKFLKAHPTLFVVSDKTVDGKTYVKLCRS